MSKLIDGVIFAGWEAPKHPRDAHGHFSNAMNRGDEESRALLAEAHKDDTTRMIAADKLDDMDRPEEAALLREHNPVLVLGGSVLRLHGDLLEDNSAHVAQTPDGHRLIIRHGGRISQVDILRTRSSHASMALERIFARQQDATKAAVVLQPKEQKSLLTALKKFGHLVDEERHPHVAVEPPAYTFYDHDQLADPRDLYRITPARGTRQDEQMRRFKEKLHWGHVYDQRRYLHANDFFPVYGSVSNYLAPNERTRARMHRREQDRLGIPLRPDGIPVHRLAVEYNARPEDAQLLGELRNAKTPEIEGYGKPNSFDEQVRDGYGGFGFKTALDLERWKTRARELGVSLTGDPA